MMKAELEALSAHAVYAARLFERALHEPSGWTITWGPFTEDAVRTLHEDGVTFEAEFPPACYLTPPHPNAELRHNGEVVAVRAIDFVGDTAFAVTWDLASKVMADGRV
jgi:hypothetical protein